MYRGWVFIGDGSPTTLCYYTVMPPNNYILRIFLGYKRIFTSFGRLHPGPFCPLAHYSPFGPDSHIIARRTRSLRGFRSACYPTPSFAGLRLRNRRCGLRRRRLNFRLSSLAFVFAVGALVFASLRLPSSSLKSLGRQKTLSLDPNGLRAFGRWPKVASPTVAPWSRCPSLEGR